MSTNDPSREHPTEPGRPDSVDTVESVNGSRRLSPRARRGLTALVGALVVVLAVTAGATLAGGATDRLAVSAGSFAGATADEEGGASAPENRSDGFRGRGHPFGHGFGHPGGRGFGGGPLAGALHGEYVEADPDGGYRTVVAQRGEVTSLSDTSLTVTSEDGFDATYEVTADTSVLGGTGGIGDVAKGDDVGVRAVRDGAETTATHILDLSRLGDLRRGRST